MSRFIRILIFTLLMAAIVFFAFRATQPVQIADSTNAPNSEQSTSTSDSASNKAVEKEDQAPTVVENEEKVEDSADTKQATSEEEDSTPLVSDTSTPAEQVEQRVIEGSTVSTEENKKTQPSEVEESKKKEE